ncbi:MAG: LamG domain-containing protein [Candidatus Poribacteria bacterium]|nr:LamG domain-containing protein [Candidatus Poribacteria bacterium]
MMQRFTIGCLLLAAAFAGTAQDNDLILYYDYEEWGADGPVDLSGKGHVGLVVGGVERSAEGQYGGAAQFSGGGYIDLDGANWPPAQIPRDGFSVVAWVNVDSLGGDHAIFNARASDETWVVHPEVKTAGNFRWLLRGNGGATIFDMKSGVAKAGEWLHFAGTYDVGDGAVLYINGEEVGTAPGGAEIAEDWGSGARVGKNIDDARPFTGRMDDLSLWTRGLTHEEVRTIMEFGPLPQSVDASGKLTTAWGALKRD